MDSQVEKPATFKEGVSGAWRHVHPYRGLLVTISLLGLVSAITNGFVPYITGHFFDALIALSHGETKTFQGIPAWMFFLGAWTGIQVVANAVDWANDRRRRAIDSKVQLRIQSEGFVHLFLLPLAYHANEPMNAIMSKLSNAGWRISAIVRTIVNIAPQLLSVAIGVTLAASINVSLAGILALGVLIYIFVLLRMLKPAAAADSLAHQVWNDSWNDAASAVNQISSVKQATAETREIRRTRSELFDRTFSLWYRMELMWSNVSFFQRLIVFITQLTVFVLSVQLVANGSLTIGELVALTGYSLMFFGPFVQLGHSWQTIQNGLTSAGQIERIFREPVERYSPDPDFKAPAATGAVVFSNVNFRYEYGQPTILSAASFEASPGTVVALVGESGAGKSTIAQLVSGYYFPTGGSVTVDGVETKDWDLTALRSRIAVVPQEVALFNESIEANIRYGSFDASHEAVAEVAKHAHIDEFIASLPQGYETLVGERGIKLSVGQKQRVAIARAMLRDPRILILDEPTSALDAETERYITASLDELMAGRTTFIIAHRLSTVRKADLILVLKDGVIAERGTHDELLAISDGVYRHLYELHVGLHE
jgi:ABC-type multidrug transport system fused ATPase/permease subunit